MKISVEPYLIRSNIVYFQEVLQHFFVFSGIFLQTSLKHKKQHFHVSKIYFHFYPKFTLDYSSSVWNKNQDNRNQSISPKNIKCNAFFALTKNLIDKNVFFPGILPLPREFSRTQGLNF